MPMTFVFIGVFFVSSLILTLIEPGFASFGDAAWFLYTVISTIGLGDYTCQTVVGRLITVLLSLFSIIYIALVTGVIVSYCDQRLKARESQSVASFVDHLEHLDDLSHEELAALSKRIRELR